MAGNKAFEKVVHDVDFCVVGGGMAGCCAALAAARHGAKVALMHDRPVLGGNASSEIRVHICGADRHNHIPNLRETGILEELRLENLYRNPARCFSVWDTILYEKLLFEPNVTLLLNCTCQDAAMDAGRIASVTGWQLTTQTFHEVRARIFADCSGDAILAPLSGALFRVGREGRSEYGESIAPEQPDRRTMGMTCLFQSRECDAPQPFAPPSWAHTFRSCDEIPYGAHHHPQFWDFGYWWIEMGGEHDSIRDTEYLRDELLKITYGVWDHIKNHCPHTRDKARNWTLAWIQFLPGKRESRRYVGEHVLTQLDIEAEGRFEDLVAYGGWTMDDHHPAGFWSVKAGAPATIFHPAPSPYGIPYRCLHSKNVANLMFAGRCHSASHVAHSSTRVMGTGSVMGQAIGAAAAMAARKGIAPAEILGHIRELQQLLLRADCYLPWVAFDHPEIMTSSALTASRGNGEPLRDGYTRLIGVDAHCWTASPGDLAAYEFDRPRKLHNIALFLDSEMDQNIMFGLLQRPQRLTSPPAVMAKKWLIEVKEGGKWTVLVEEANNYQRHRRFDVGRTAEAVRFTLQQTWGAPRSRVYGFHLE